MIQNSFWDVLGQNQRQGAVKLHGFWWSLWHEFGEIFNIPSVWIIEGEQDQTHTVAPSVRLVQLGLGQWQKVWQVEPSCLILDLLCSTQPTIIKQIAWEKQHLFRYQTQPRRTGQTRYARKEKVKKENREGAKEKREDEGKEDGGEAQRGTWRLTDLAVVTHPKSLLCRI